jgi:hypothetical protein
MNFGSRLLGDFEVFAMGKRGPTITVWRVSVEEWIV